ncbi:IS110 family transposase [Sansalvadorimonas sp. 2012CJ34-2]|uniref:IS110 family transposase n=1 Tax=Parendozoicomonas callyspongiae TaxID=2942213 RepID=A0ABT0PLK6_9GAMM|nr:IS110 family transposase [Sansalvadorimonas sp. 2012CJ34-2]MCL6272265.1 IS110 family transposase [Sansalvadorimonas sp. 2012CJ34-2]
MQPILKSCAGLDVHKMMVMVTIQVEDDDGNVTEQTRSFKTFRRDRKALRNFLMEQAVELVVMESTGNYWQCIHDILARAGLSVWIVNARHVKNVPGRKTDVLDSQWLASLGRCGLLRPSFVPPPDIQQLRLLFRRRQKLISQRSSEKNRLHKVLDDAGIRLGGVVSDIHGKSAQDMIQGLIDGKHPAELAKMARGRMKSKVDELFKSLDGELSRAHRTVLKDIREHVEYLDKRIAALDEVILQIVRSDYREPWQVLQTLPGIDQIAAAGIIAEVGPDMSAFNGRESLTSWAGLCPGNNESAGKRKSGKTRKGNQSLRRLLCEAANAAIKTNSQFKGKYQSLVIRRGHKRNIIAIAHKILRVIHCLLSKLQPYHDPDIDYEALTVHKNAPRWLQKLQKFGYLQGMQKA